MDLVDAARSRLDDEGFLPLDDLRALAQQAPVSSLGLSVPALLVSSVEDQQDQRDDIGYRRTVDSEFLRQPPNVQLAAEGIAAGRYSGQVAFLVKRPGNPFPQMISVGRAANSDIVFQLATVSKVQGYFLKEPQGWAVVDQRSRNGTFLNGRQLGDGEKPLVQDGDRIRFGDQITVEFLEIAGLLRRLGMS